MNAIPVIDLAAARAGTPGAMEDAAAALGRACRETGFFYAAGHGIDTARIEAAFAAARAFFAQPQAVKDASAIAKSMHNRGYVAPGAERLDTTRPADAKEAFNIGLDLAADDPEVLAGKPFRGVNQWPDLAGFRAATLAYFDACWALGRFLHRLFARDLQLREDYFEDKLDRPLATLRLLRYPPHPPDAAPGQRGAGEHTDYGNVTLLTTDGTPGLEVRRRDGTWLAAPHVPGAFVCNIGDCLMRWSNDVYVSTPHRVVNRGTGERYSIAFFLDPNPDAEVACLPSCAGPDRPARYPPTDGAAYLAERLNATYDFRA